MKKLITMIVLFITVSSYAQITKADADALLNSFPSSGYNYVFVGNDREYYNDGSSKMEQHQYYANKMIIEPKEHALYLKFYTDESKSTLSQLTVIPYDKILLIEAHGTAFIIDLVQ